MTHKASRFTQSPCEEAARYCAHISCECPKTWPTKGLFGVDSRPNPYLAFPLSWPQTIIWPGEAAGNGINIYSNQFAFDGTGRYGLDQKIVPLAGRGGGPLYMNQGNNGKSFNVYPVFGRIDTDNAETIVAPPQYDGGLLCLRRDP